LTLGNSLNVKTHHKFGQPAGITPLEGVLPLDFNELSTILILTILTHFGYGFNFILNWLELTRHLNYIGDYTLCISLNQLG